MSHLDEKELKRGVYEVIAEQLDADLDKITPESHLMNDLGADSLDAVELVMALEERFGCSISDDEAQTIQTVGDAINFIKNKLNL